MFVRGVGRPIGDIPESHGVFAALAARKPEPLRGQELFTVAREFDQAYISGMARQRSHKLFLLKVPDLDLTGHIRSVVSVSATAGKPLSIRREGQGVDIAFLRSKYL